MSTYIMLCNWTDQGIRHVKDSPDRLDAARQLCRQHGAEITEFYMTMGAYDMGVVIDAPNEEEFAKLAISIAKGGNTRTTTLRRSARTSTERSSAPSAESGSGRHRARREVDAEESCANVARIAIAASMLTASSLGSIRAPGH